MGFGFDEIHISQPHQDRFLTASANAS
jgi:hypothetical protein